MPHGHARLNGSPAHRRKNTLQQRVLVVDDDEAIRDSMTEFLSLSGYHTGMAASAEEALEMICRQPVDVIITDIMMEGMNGLQLTDRVKKEFDIDVIVMTGYSDDYSYEEAVRIGASDFVFKPIRFEELLLRLKRVLKERALTRERREMMAKLEKLAITDGLTRLYNSRYFYAQLKIEIDRSRRYHHPLALMLLDIDFFKDYNDTYGHLEGDKVLIRIGEIIRSSLRNMDSAYRYGGEEFTIILPETSAEEAVRVAPRIQAGLKASPFTPGGGPPVNITMSIGVTQYCPEEDISTFVQRADRAMYMSKSNGRNRISALPADADCSFTRP
jgi:diguanylate cyclase (GGDEF)-like protein